MLYFFARLSGAVIHIRLLLSDVAAACFLFMTCRVALLSCICLLTPRASALPLTSSARVPRLSADADCSSAIFLHADPIFMPPCSFHASRRVAAPAVQRGAMPQQSSGAKKCQALLRLPRKVVTRPCKHARRCAKECRARGRPFLPRNGAREGVSACSRLCEQRVMW